MFWKKKEKKEEPQPKNNGRFKPAGSMSVSEAILASWSKIDGIFSLHQIAYAVRRDTDRQHLDTTISAALRRLRKQGRIDYALASHLTSHYVKIF